MNAAEPQRGPVVSRLLSYHRRVRLLAARALVLLAVLASCKRSSESSARPAPSASAAASAQPAASANKDAPPDELFWVGELPPGTIERRVCAASTRPFRPIAQAALDPDSYLFVARIVAQGWQSKPLPSRQRVGSIYLSVLSALRGDALQSGTLVALPIDEEPCHDGGPCTDWSSYPPNSVVVVGCSVPKPHVAFDNALFGVAGPQATAVDELRACVAMQKSGTPQPSDAGLAGECARALAAPVKGKKPDAGGRKP